jgi:methanogenic corrinoid protein MtbC1
MDGLDQVSEDQRCYEGPTEHLPSVGLHTGQPRDYETPAAARMQRLARTIEGEVIPRLLMAHRTDLLPPAAPVEAVKFDERAAERLARMVLAQNDEAAMAYVHALIADGLPLETIYLDLLAPSARWLGQQWADDELTFTDVTLGLSRLQRVMRILASSVGEATRRDRNRFGRIVLATVPGEQHLFGLLMLEEFFRRDGWEVECLPGVNRADLIEAVRQCRPEAVGISASVDDHLDDLRVLIADMRAAVQDRSLVVMVGGRCFDEDPKHFKTVGADFTAVDGRHAVSHIHTYMSNNLDSLTGQRTV